MSTNNPNDKVSFRCSDAGHAGCNWQTSGKNEQEIMPKIEQHARESHNINVDENTRSKIRNTIRRQAA